MIAASLLAVLLVPAAVHPAADEALERAITAELGRAKREFKDDGYPSVYHAAINVWDFDDWDRWGPWATRRYDESTHSSSGYSRGRARTDNHPVTAKTEYLESPFPESDEFALRHALWRALDGAYMTASADYLRKAQVSRAARPSTTPMTVCRGRARVPGFVRPRLGTWTACVGSRTRFPVRFRGFRGLHAESHVGLRRSGRGAATPTARRWTRRRTRVDMEAAALSADGLRQSVYCEFYARTPADLPRKWPRRSTTCWGLGRDARRSRLPSTLRRW